MKFEFKINKYYLVSYVMTSKNISDDQWKEAATWYYALPKE